MIQTLQQRLESCGMNSLTMARCGDPSARQCGWVRRLLLVIQVDFNDGRRNFPRRVEGICARWPGTGGVLLGIVDMSRKSIHIAHAMPELEDSHGTRVGFGRGVIGLLDQVNHAVERSMYQLRYVGEWHSHPNFSSAIPSTIDIAQLAWLELAGEGLIDGYRSGRWPLFVFNNQHADGRSNGDGRRSTDRLTQ
jgi:hypothetical protein